MEPVTHTLSSLMVAILKPEYLMAVLIFSWGQELESNMGSSSHNRIAKNLTVVSALDFSFYQITKPQNYINVWPLLYIAPLLLSFLT